MKLKNKRAGRKPKQGVARYPGGQILHSARAPAETQAQILSTALAQPHRAGAKDPRSHHLGYELGRLMLAGRITRDELEAGNEWAALWVRYHARVTGLTIPRVSAHLADIVASGGAPARHANDDDDHDIERLRGRWDAAQQALADKGIHEAGNRVLMSVCVLDRPVKPEWGMILRAALSAVSARKAA